MLTDAEMQKLLDDHEKYDEVLPYAVEDEFSKERAYLLALDAALPKLVEEIRHHRMMINSRMEESND